MKYLLPIVLLAAPAAAQTAPPAKAPPPAGTTGTILDKAINLPGSNWQVYGPNQASKMTKTTGIPGNQAMRVQVTAKGANPWDVGALSPIQKPVGAGDVLLVAVYARAPDLGEGQTTPITITATATAAPYDGIAQGDATVAREWKLYYAAGKAGRAFAANTARVSVQLAAAKHVVELGPVFVLDFGPNADPAKLPHN